MSVKNILVVVSLFMFATIFAVSCASAYDGNCSVQDEGFSVDTGNSEGYSDESGCPAESTDLAQEVSSCDVSEPTEVSCDTEAVTEDAPVCDSEPIADEPVYEAEESVTETCNSDPVEEVTLESAVTETCDEPVEEDFTPCEAEVVAESCGADEPTYNYVPEESASCEDVVESCGAEEVTSSCDSVVAASPCESEAVESTSCGGEDISCGDVATEEEVSTCGSEEIVASVSTCGAEEVSTCNDEIVASSCGGEDVSCGSEEVSTCGAVEVSTCSAVEEATTCGAVVEESTCGEELVTSSCGGEDVSTCGDELVATSSCGAEEETSTCDLVAEEVSEKPCCSTCEAIASNCAVDTCDSCTCTDCDSCECEDCECSNCSTCDEVEIPVEEIVDEATVEEEIIEEEIPVEEEEEDAEEGVVTSTGTGTSTVTLCSDNVCTVGGNGEVISLINHDDAANPTMAELLAFLKADTTDEGSYTSTYVCSDFAKTLHDRAEASGIRAGWVGANGANHAFNVFQTIDNGTVYIDCTGVPGGATLQDKRVYVTIGEPLTEEYLFRPYGSFTDGGAVQSLLVYW